MSYRSIIVPRASNVEIAHQTNLGVYRYDVPDLYSPDTAVWKGKVLDLISPKDTPTSTYIFDGSRYRNHGTITGAVWRQLPSGLRYLDFDGSDDKVTVTANSVFNVGASDSFTVIAWAKGLTGNDASAEVIQRMDTHYWQVRASAGKFRLILSGADGTTESTSTVATDDNLWHFVAGVRSAGGTNFLFVDTAITDSDADVSGAFTLTDDVKIGGGETAFWKGGIALERYITTALTEAQLLVLRNQERHLFGV